MEPARTSTRSHGPDGGAGWSMTAPRRRLTSLDDNTLKSARRASPFTTAACRPPTMTTTARPRVSGAQDRLGSFGNRADRSICSDSTRRTRGASRRIADGLSDTDQLSARSHKTPQIDLSAAVPRRACRSHRRRRAGPVVNGDARRAALERVVSSSDVSPPPRARSSTSRRPPVGFHVIESMSLPAPWRPIVEAVDDEATRRCPSPRSGPSPGARRQSGIP